MELKTAVGVCLISLFSATLVVLIVRFLDRQAASRLEPSLTRIAEELEAIRRQGAVTTVSGEPAANRPTDDALMVYYFHGVRCPTCRAAEANALETLKTRYASQLDRGEVVWKVLDYTKDPLAADFNVIASTIVLVKMKGGEIDTWNRLDRTLALAKDRPALAAYLQDEIDKMLGTSRPEPKPAQPAEPPAIPVPQ